MTNEIKYTINEDNQLVDCSTGEIITKRTFTEEMNAWLQENYSDYAKEMLNLGKELEFKLQKVLNREYYVTNPKENYTFTKVFKVEVRNLMNNLNEFDRLSIHEKGVIATFEAHLSFPDNSVVINGETPHIKDLPKIIGVGKTKLNEVLASLEEKEIIKRRRMNDRTIIYMNPYLYSCGLVKQETMDLFDNSKYKV